MKISNIFIISIFLFTKLFANNNSISGLVTDSNDTPIVGANVFVIGSVLGSSTNQNGLFQIKNIPKGTFNLSISVIGYEEHSIEISVEENQQIDLGKIRLNESPINASPIIITASKYRQNIKEVPVSVSTVDKSDIEIRNNVSVEDALKYVSGINLNQDQINIRGSSGYSRGVGSRVMMLVDGVPFITGDTQGTVPEAITINQVEQIEIVKGAASALYGSSAIGGVINIITKPIAEEPEYNFKMYGGLYDDPYYETWKWSENTRYKYGFKAGFSQKINKTGLRLAFSKDQDESYRKNDNFNRFNIGGKIEQNFSAYEKLVISGNYYDQKRNSFLYWESLSNALVPTENQIGQQVHSTRYYISPAYSIIISDSNFINVSVMWFHNEFDDNIDAGNNSKSDNLNVNFQYNTSLATHFLTFGFSTDYNTIRANIFGERNGYGFALYAQDEIRWNQQWLTSIGTRFDYFDIDKLGSDYSLNPKIGIVFQLNSESTFRSSFGSGFRAPSMAEAFTSTVASGITVIPNENLKPEKSISSEIGWNQIFSNYFNSDVAIFYNRYFDLIESGFTEDLKAQFNNVTDAEISGIEVSVSLNMFNKSLMSNSGITFLEPRNLTGGESGYLKYRPRRLIHSNLTWKFQNFIAGLDYRYISKYDKIDEEFASIIADGNTTIAVHVVDTRISYSQKIGNFPIKISLQVNNILQYNYIDLIGSIAPIRNYIFALETSL